MLSAKRSGAEIVLAVWRIRCPPTARAILPRVEPSLAYAGLLFLGRLTGRLVWRRDASPSRE